MDVLTILRWLGAWVQIESADLTHHALTDMNVTPHNEHSANLELYEAQECRPVHGTTRKGMLVRNHKLVNLPHLYTPRVGNDQ